MTDVQEAVSTATELPKKKTGWPKGKPRGKRVAPREALRDDVHPEMHAKLGPRTRQRDEGGRFFINPDLKARYLPGRTVEWKKHTVLGQEDQFYEIDLRRAGWEPVQNYQMPGLMPKGYKGAIVRDGLMLYERPEELTAEARAEERAAAKERMLNNERRLGQAAPGEMTRDHPEIRPSVQHSYEPISIPKR